MRIKQYGVSGKLEDVPETISPENVTGILKIWDGYISPDGMFIATKPSEMGYWNGSFNCHDDVAALLLEEEKPAGVYFYKDALIQAKKFVSVTFYTEGRSGYTLNSVSYDYPSGMTQAQKNVLWDIWQARGLDPKEYEQHIRE